MQAQTGTQSPILSVSELNQYAKGVLEMHVGKVWVSGEVSNLAKPASGHWYFTLKDQTAQIRCAMFKGKNRFVRANLANGQQILVQGSVSIYPGRGDYQMIADYIEESGVGALQRQFEQLKNRLAAEGLFESRHKKHLPQNPKHIAVITSATGAAVHDILTVLKERFPLLKITVIPAAVQGDQAAGQLCRALHLAEHWNNTEDDIFDAIIIGRGGGSIEDLWPFNEESVARTIFQCPIPIISAVGHEVDTTIADYVADVRAATPSAAAEIISPDQQALFQQLDHFEKQLEHKIMAKLAHAQHQLQTNQAALRHPGERLHLMHQRFEQLKQRLHHVQQQQLKNCQHQLQTQAGNLLHFKPQQAIQEKQAQLQQLEIQLAKLTQQQLSQKKQQLASAAHLLESVSPLATLKRGYAIVKQQDKILRQTDEVEVGQMITTQLSSGELDCEIKAIRGK
ncbi:MAG: exodeoxyribonuclease VII large subunit [Pseudomonadales bacterium]|nr:exodeoxyribonuclease VII large subunit [Pseudomonadales bacterium]